WGIGREISGIDIVRPDQRGRMLSGFHGLHTTGMAVGPAFGGVLTELVNFRAVFVAFAIVAAMAVLLGAISHNAKPPESVNRLPKRRSSLAAVLGIRPMMRSFVDLLKQIDPAFRATYAVLTFATFSSFLFRMGVQSILPLYASAELGLSPTETGLLFSISGGVVFAMILPAGFIIDKVGRKWATVPSNGLPFIALLLIPFSDTFLQLAALISIVGMANGLSLGSLASSTYDIAPAGARGRLQATRRTIAETGGIAAPLAGGILADAYGPGVPFVVFAPVLLISALLLAFVAKETLVKHGAVTEKAPVGG
ncbi:MAG: MFS transporter, partial [Dehalococcoidia bacterium]